MENQVILSPQWIIDSITYVVRDIQLHRFIRDRRAMDLLDGSAWSDLVLRGILTEPLLDCLWIDRREHRDFLLQLMHKLGLFAELPIKTDLGELRYFVPSTVSAVIPRSPDGSSGGGGGGGGDGSGNGNGGDGDNAAVSSWQHLGLQGCCAPANPSDQPNAPFETLKRLTPQPVCVRWLLSRSTEPDALPHRFTFDFKGFLPNGFFERVVSQLVSDWPAGYKDSDPHILWNAAELCVSCPEYRLVLIVDKEGHTITAVVADTHASDIIPQVKVVVDNVNKGFYSDRVIFDSPSCPEPKFRAQERALMSTVANVRTLENDEDFLALRSFFEQCDVKPAEDAERYAAAGYKAHSKNSLKSYYDACKRRHKDADAVFCKDLQESVGISSIKHQTLIMDRLDKMPPLDDPQKYLIGYYASSNLDHVEREREVIKRALDRKRLLADFRRVGTLDDFDSGLSECRIRIPPSGYRVLHLAMHGHLQTLAGKHTLAFSDRPPPEPDAVAQVVADCCIQDGGVPRGCIECVFINACFGSAIGERLRSDKVPWVVTWTTSVDDEAAQAFAEEFYLTLSGNPADFREIGTAFERAKKKLRQRQWVIDDDGGDPGPSGRPLLLARQRREQNIKLKAAGIPKLYEPSQPGPAPAVDSHELSFEVWTADGTEQINPAFSIASESFEALEQRLTSRDLGYRKPTVQYLHGRTGEKRALGTDLELGQAVLSYRDAPVPGRAVKLIVTNAYFRVAVQYGFDRDQCDELQDIQGLLLEANGYEVLAHPNCESLSTLSARMLHFATHGDRSRGILELINGNPRFLPSTELIKKLTDRRVKPECIVLNICASDEYARVLIDKGAQFGLRCVIYWAKECLEATLARDFTREFYRSLTQCTNMIHDYRGAFAFAKEQMRELRRGAARSYSVDDIECLQLWWCEALLASSSEVESDATRSWKPADACWPSTFEPAERLCATDSQLEFACIAGFSHERECLRTLGIRLTMEVKDNDFDTTGGVTVVEIGQTVRPQDEETHGNGKGRGGQYGLKGASGMHKPESLCLLFGCGAVCAAPHKYENLWQTVAKRAAANCDWQKAIRHLDEAVWCRKWDLWCSQKAQVLVHNVAKGRIPAGTSPERASKLIEAMLPAYPVKRALQQGLTEVAATRVAQGWVDAFLGGVAQVAVTNADLSLAKGKSDTWKVWRETARKSARTILDAECTKATDVQPKDWWKTLTPDQPWQAFVGEMTLHYTVAENDIANKAKATFENHLAIVESLLQSLHALDKAAAEQAEVQAKKKAEEAACSLVCQMHAFP
jgi:hypothetical protein